MSGPNKLRSARVVQVMTPGIRRGRPRSLTPPTGMSHRFMPHSAAKE